MAYGTCQQTLLSWCKRELPLPQVFPGLASLPWDRQCTRVKLWRRILNWFLARMLATVVIEASGPTAQFTGNTLLVREGTSVVPGVPGASFLTFSPSSINKHGTVASRYLLNVAGSVTTNNRLGLWTHRASGGTLIARQGVGAVPGVPGALFESFDGSSINADDAVAYSATLRHAGGVSSANDRGIWLYDGGAAELLAREAAADAPGIAGASFLDFQLPHLNDAGQVFVQADLITGVGGVNVTNNQGIWRLEDATGTSELVARIGSGGVPEVVGADFENFTSWTFNDVGQIALAAELAIGPGGVTSRTNQGIWILDPSGTSKLVARTGDLIAGETILSLSLSADKAIGTRAFNDSGDLVFRAELASGGDGLFLYEAQAGFSSADFNESGGVDGNDLLLWHGNFGTVSGLLGDADEDEDVDGEDFLTWQREFEGSTGQLTTVPEASSLMTLLVSLLPFRLGRQKH